MVLFFPNEADTAELRCAATPDSVKRLCSLEGTPEVRVEAGLGLGCGFSDADYESAGAVVVDSREAGLRDATHILRIHAPDKGGIEMLSSGGLC